MNGLYNAFITEKAIRQEIFGVFAFVALAVFMDCTPGEALCVFAASLFPISIELINTAVERIIDSNYGPVYRDEVRIQKDMLSAAVSISLLIGYGLSVWIIFFK